MILLRSGPKVISIPSKHRVQKLAPATIRTFNNVRETPYPPTPPPPPRKLHTGWRLAQVKGSSSRMHHKIRAIAIAASGNGAKIRIGGRPTRCKLPFFSALKKEGKLHFSLLFSLRKMLYLHRSIVRNIVSFNHTPFMGIDHFSSILQVNGK